MRDHITWPRIEVMYDYWEDNPPVHLMVAGYLGLSDKRKKRKKDGNGGYQDHSELLGLFNQA